jgi:hypothetical protein
MKIRGIGWAKSSKPWIYTTERQSTVNGFVVVVVFACVDFLSFRRELCTNNLA